LFRGRAKEAKQGCDKLFEGALPTTWIGEVGLTLAKAELQLGDNVQAKLAAEQALAKTTNPRLKEQLEEVLTQLRAEGVQ
ncbi:MAG: hypothetical protein JRH20_23880, partial [Deltaproteobacteria bacterium]|nr:hypothetical protein [Deltaproteobacteria bacterium]